MFDLRALGRWLSPAPRLPRDDGDGDGDDDDGDGDGDGGHDERGRGGADPSPLHRLLTWVYRPQCGACGAPVSEGLPFCGSCSLSLDENLVSCRRCAEPLSGPRGGVCRRCHKAPLPLAQISAPWLYGGALAEAIVRLKFSRRPEVARALAPLISPVLYTVAKVSETTLIVPIPLHWTRRLRRGFDQSQLLLQHICRLHRPAAQVADLLSRVRATPYQSRAEDARGRVRNMLGAFRVRPRWLSQVRGARVLLFDDVVTTGATMAAAARVLRRAGAAEVVGVALARGGSAS